MRVDGSEMQLGPRETLNALSRVTGSWWVLKHVRG